MASVALWGSSFPPRLCSPSPGTVGTASLLIDKQPFWNPQATRRRRGRGP